jgi:hypothetical protein
MRNSPVGRHDDWIPHVRGKNSDSGALNLRQAKLLELP